MKLLTFGGVSVEGVTFRREKPLLLLAYLCLEGPQPRRRLASLFWPDAANPMNSLAQNLIRLRPLSGAVLEQAGRVEALIPSDAQAFRDHCRAARPADALTLYHGAFLDGLNAALNPDLEEWLLDTRETLAREARAAHLSLAEHRHARSEHPQAHAHATHAYHTPGAPPCDPEDLLRLWQILGLSDHPLTLTLRRDASELGLTLHAPAPTPPTHTLIGRATELDILNHLPAGQIAWISGPPGIGKTALIDSLAHTGWRVLPARGGLPLATLEPLSAHPLGSAADALNLLRDTRLKLALDDWEDMDETTRATLTLAARQHPGATIAITARQPPALPTHHHIPLHSLTEQDLQGHPGAHAATGGHPTLLASYLNGTPPDRTLDAHLTLLGPDHRRLFLALAAQDTPNLGATRAALNLTPATLAATLDTLTREGLTTSGGRVRASTPAQHLLDTHPLDTALTHLHLARHHPTETAWPHWLRARDLWEPSDQESIENAALFTAAKYYDNGNVNKAVKVLENCLFSDELRLVVSEYNLSIGAIEKIEARVSCCADSVRKFIVLADLKYRIGLYDEAKLYISRLPNDKGMVSGWKNMLVAHISMREYKLDIAKNYYSYAISYFNASKNTGMSLLCESILLRIEDNGDVRRKYSGIVEKSIHFPIQHPTIVLNNAEWLASKYEEQTVEKEYIVNLYDCAISKFDDIGHMTGVASALNSKGAFFHMRRMFSLAGKCYEDSLEFASRASNLRLQTIIRANIAELSNDEREFKKTIDFLKHDSDNILSSVIVSNKLPSQ